MNRLILLTLLTGLLIQPAAASGSQPGQEITVLVRTDSAKSSLRSLGGMAALSDRSVLGWSRVTISTSESPFEAVRRLSEDLGLPVTLDHRLELFAPEDDPLFDSQWHLENEGQTGGTPGADIDASAAWDLTTGQSGVVVAVVDSGTDLTHPDLAAAIAINPAETPGNGIDDDANGYVDDVQGWDFVDEDGDPTPVSTPPNGPHGTWVSGLIGARANGTGIVGVAPDVSILPLRACNPSSCNSFDVAAAVSYAVLRGAAIVNLSLGGYIPATFAQNDPLTDAIALAQASGVLVVAASGNDGWNLDSLTGATVNARYSSFPASAEPFLMPGELANPNILTVAASDHDDQLAAFSNYGSTIVDVAAPGDAVATTGLGASYDTVSGTSFAAPIAAGVAALMFSINPDLTPEQAIDLVKTYGTRLDALTGTSTSGARIDADDTISAARLRDIQDSVFRDDVIWLADAGITKGCNPPANDRFCPDSAVTRGQMAAFLDRALVLAATSTDYFSDDTESEFEDSINRLAAAGITNGCGDGSTYCPDDRISREQMAAFLVRALGYTDPGSVDFVDDDGSIFEPEIEKLAAAGVTRGCNPPTNDRFCPRDPVTRGQMAAFLRRALG